MDLFQITHPSVASLTLFAPAKLNLFLAITGRRADGFHDLVSLAAPVDFGDTLTVEVGDGATDPGWGVLTCTDPAVPCDESNLILRAVRAFARAAGWNGSATIHLEKRIPMGAGLGGGSSNGAATLRALNTLLGQPLDEPALVALATTLGSDCPLFLNREPVIMRGRGERLERLNPDLAARLRGLPVLVFKPRFGVPTAWAYRRLAEMADEAKARARADVYLPAAVAEQRLAGWTGRPGAPVVELLYNNLERPVFDKFIALPTMFDRLEREFGLAPRMTGSGSACFAFLPDAAPADQISATVRAGWGDSSFVVETRMS
jgi:4-diphosphocytidyl-2-C-methyl-D-erythritol kinase